MKQNYETRVSSLHGSNVIAIVQRCIDGSRGKSSSSVFWSILSVYKRETNCTMSMVTLIFQVLRYHDDGHGL